MISFNILSHHSSISSKRSRIVFNYHKADAEALNDYLFGIDLSSTPNFCDVEYAWSHLKSAIYCARDLFVPKFKASSHTSPKWFNSDIRHQLNRIHTLRNRIKKSATFYTLSKLSIMEENLQQLILSSKDKFVQNLCSTFKFKPKELYNHLN